MDQPIEQLTYKKGRKHEITDEVLDRCIEIYMQTGNMATVGKAIGRSRVWVGQLFKQPRAIERMKGKTLAIVNNNPNIANIEECMTKLTDIVRGSQLEKLSDKVKKIVANGGSSVDVEHAIDQIKRTTPQIENNQIKAITMLLTTQGALDPKKAAREDHNEVIEDIILAMVKARTVDSVLDKLTGDVIDVTPESKP
jgi:hypothetical protein